MVEPSKEVGHDTKRSLVMPMDISSWELPGSVGEVASIVRVRCWRAIGSLELFVYKARLPRGATAVQP
jgi:hypothetical protein